MIVKSIDSFETYDWFLNKHYAKRIPSISYAFGFYIDNVLEGVCTFGKPASNPLCIGVCGEHNSAYVYELNRLITNDDLPKNSLSFFVSKCLKMLPPLIIVSYADKGQNHNGYIYQATNFIYTGLSSKSRDKKIVGSDKHPRHNNIYEKQGEWEYVERTRKHRYIYFTGSKKQNKKWLKELNYKIHKYPKGENKTYDASYKPQTQIKIF
jgi:hypothetical protein